MRELGFSSTENFNSEPLQPEIGGNWMKDLKLQPSYTVALNSGGRRILGELEANMLKSIDETGSFSQAARSLGLSYPFLWNTISQIEKSLNRKIVMSERGGAKGGRAVLTGEGKRLLRAYTALDSRVNRFLKGEVPREEYLPRAGHVRPDLRRQPLHRG
jgi:molybdate transport system regulatory protein